MERKWLRPSEWLHSSLFLPLTLAAMTLAMFAGVIFSSGDRTLSQFGTDLAAEFVYWRKFGFDQLRAGHIALWNPYVFSGVPFMGGFQAAHDIQVGSIQFRLERVLTVERKVVSD